MFFGYLLFGSMLKIIAILSLILSSLAVYKLNRVFHLSLKQNVLAMFFFTAIGWIVLNQLLIGIQFMILAGTILFGIGGLIYLLTRPRKTGSPQGGSR